MKAAASPAGPFEFHPKGSGEPVENFKWERDVLTFLLSEVTMLCQ